MSVIKVPSDDAMLLGVDASEVKRCSLCLNEVQRPYIFYHGFTKEDANAHIFICSDCTVRHGRGLMADIVEMLATNDLQTLYGKGSMYFKRVSYRSLEAEQKAQRSKYTSIDEQ